MFCSLVRFLSKTEHGDRGAYEAKCLQNTNGAWLQTLETYLHGIKLKDERANYNNVATEVKVKSCDGEMC